MTHEELQAYFNGIDLPNETIYLTPAEAIKPENLRKFINSHLTSILHNPKSPTAAADHDRLIRLVEILEAKPGE